MIACGLLLVVISASSSMQDPREIVPARLDPTALSLEELIDHLPVVGAEWIKPVARNQPWELVPVAAEFRDRVERGAVLTAEQWKRTLVSTGVLRLRERWPVSEPFAVSMRYPGWLVNTAIRLVPREAGLQPAEVGWLNGHPSCGTYAMQTKRAWLYQELGALPPGPRRLAFDLALERGRPYRRSSSRPAGESEPPVGPFFRGEIAFDVEIVPTIDQAIPPRSGPELDAAVRSTLSLAFDDWSSGRTALLVADPDIGNPLLSRLGLSLTIDILQGEQFVESAVLVPSSYDFLASGISVHDAPEQPFAWTTLRKFPVALEHDAEGRASWSVRVCGTSEHVLALWPAASYWNGTLTVSIDELITRERTVAPLGRGPWVYMPTFR
jgi:hypothetical protein